MTVLSGNHFKAMAAFVGAVSSCFTLWAHNPEARYVELMPWKREHIPKVYALGYSELGLHMDQARATMKLIEGRPCIVGSVVGFDVDDSYAFDIDEPVKATITYATEHTTPTFAIVWNKNGGDGQGRVDVTSEPGATFRSATVTMDRARFAGAGNQGIDIAAGIPSRPGKIAVCDISINRSGTTKPASSFGTLKIEVTGLDGRPLPARVGLYDATGRAPLASESAITVERFGDKVRQLPLNAHVPWPSGNRIAFYTSGSYETRVPAGSYELAASRGLEYRTFYGKVDIKPEKSQTVQIKLVRYADLPGRGWYSGDAHIHLGRDETRDLNVWTQVAAEDLHVGNLLQMGAISETYFIQPAWGESGRFTQGTTTVVSGQEDPRTGHLGHTIHHNLTAPLHPSQDSYFIYNKVFEGASKQGGVSGFAHLGEWFHARRGIAMELPFGLINFLEVLQSGRLATDVWYDSLNLGFKVNPAAGSDFPYTDLPGIVRNYAKVEGGQSTDEWYKAFRAGRTYVTNGPFLEFTVNGHQMGEEFTVEPGADLQIEAEVTLNPDVDKLDRLELVVHGEVIEAVSAQGRDKISFKTKLSAASSLWLAVRAYGFRQDRAGNRPNITVAHTAPVYVIVGNKSFWKPSEVPELVRRQLAALEDIRSGKLNPLEDLENFATFETLEQEWPKQRALLLGRVDEASRRYQMLLDSLPSTSAQKR